MNIQRDILMYLIQTQANNSFSQRPNQTKETTKEPQSFPYIGLKKMRPFHILPYKTYNLFCDLDTMVSVCFLCFAWVVFLWFFCNPQAIFGF